MFITSTDLYSCIVLDHFQVLLQRLHQYQVSQSWQQSDESAVDGNWESGNAENFRICPLSHAFSYRVLGNQHLVIAARCNQQWNPPSVERISTQMVSDHVPESPPIS
jgi:hypothetical protein